MSAPQSHDSERPLPPLRVLPIPNPLPPSRGYWRRRDWSGLFCFAIVALNVVYWSVEVARWLLQR